MKKKLLRNFCAVLLTLLCVTLINENLKAQDKIITGKVTDASDGGMLPGVTVRLRGTTVGTATDANGNYSINAPANAVLEFALIGYGENLVKTEAGKSIYNIKLNAISKGLDEVVVVGYGTSTKRDLTGAVAKIDNTKLEALPNVNILQALRGGTAGVSITSTGRAGSGSAVQIRGGSRSIAASNNALIVLDGIIYRGGLSDLNSDDIESFEILKDASAAAIYGSQAANGVVIITTKRGKTDKPTIHINSYVGGQDFVKNQKLENAAQYRQKLFDVANTTFYRQSNGQLAGTPVKPNFDDVSTYFLNPTEIKNFNLGNSQEALDVISQSAPIQNYNLSLSAANDKTNYFVSGEYANQKGVVKGDQFKRASGRVNLETHVTDWLKFGVNSFFTFNDNSGTPADLLQASRLSPYASYYLPDNPTILKPNPVDDGFISNPLFGTLNRSTITRSSLFAVAYADVNIPFIKGLNYRFNYSNNSQWDQNFNFTPSYKTPGTGLNREASANQTNSNSTDAYVENILKYNRTFGDHSVDATFLYNYNYSKSNSTTASANTFPNDALTYYSLSLGATQATSASYSAYASIAAMARLTYKYKNRYIITGTFRRDGASVFGDKNKFANFPSVGVSWIVSDESFLKDVKVINVLKLRASYGGNGNQIGRYASLSPLAVNAGYNYIFGDGTVPAVGIGTTGLGNPDLKWELTYASNIGVDFELLNRRISGSLDVYNSNSSDLLLPRTIPTINGFGSQLQNIGKVNNKGIEFTLNTINIKTPNLTWTTGINLSANKNKIVALQGTDNNKDGIEDDDIASSRFIGKPINAIYNYEVIGVWQQDEAVLAKTFAARPGDLKLRDIDGDGKITPGNDRTIIGYDNPDVVYGFNTSLTYKGFSFYTLITGSAGGMRNNNAILDPASNLITKARGASVAWWTPDNPSTTHPSIDYGNSLGVVQLQSTSFIRVQDISLSYNFGKRITDLLKVGALKLYVSAKNPILITKWSGWDPEIAAGLNQFPLTRSIIGGLSLSL
ncbi:SusC/RagA family TonB-linked outer membrane protein [Pedobacter changchengzhani]|nr:TonB-dependent receptor [Pedobacter changchengzhani]